MLEFFVNSLMTFSSEEPLETPPFIDPFLNNHWPLEIEGGPSAWFLDGNAQWDARMQDNRDMIRANHYWGTGRFEAAMQIVAQNPNVGIEYRITGDTSDFPSYFRDLVDSGHASGTIFGTAAAGFLNQLSILIDSNFLVEQPTIKDNEVREFFKLSSNCLNGLQATLRRNFGNFFRSLNNMKSINATQLLDRSFKELKIDWLSTDGMLYPPEGVLRKYAFAHGIASARTNTAYLFSAHYSSDAFQRGMTKVHEQLHIFFRKNHIGILEELGLPKTEKGTIRLGDKDMEIPQDFTSSDALNNWLGGGCNAN